METKQTNGSKNHSNSNGQKKVLDEKNETTVVSEPESMADVMKVLPPNALEIDVVYSFLTVLRVWLFVYISYVVLYYCPWYLLPLAWIFTGTAATGLFVVAHDCAHQSFNKSSVVNEIVGTLCMMPLAFPYNGWDMTHTHHHNHANNMDKDHLWRPMTKEEVSKMGTISKWVKYYMYGPLFFQSSIFHHAYHFVIPFVSRRNRIPVIRSTILALIGGYLSITMAIRLGGFVKFWLLPFLVFQFWLSTETYFHHRLPPSRTPPNNKVGWKKEEDWSKLYGGLYATVHVDYPAWVEYLTLDINWHLPHHVSSRIPWYRLRQCTFALLKAYGDRLHTSELNWTLWQETTTNTLLYDKEEGYAPMW